MPSMVLVCRDVCLPFSLSLLPLLHKYYQYVMFFQDDGWCQGTLLRGVPGGVQGVSGGVSRGFPGVSRGFRDNLTLCFSKIEGVSSGPAKP